VESEARKLVGFNCNYERLAQEEKKEILICEPSKKGKTISERKGFSIEFSNGNSISVQFGTHMYCDQTPDKTGSVKNAEIAIMRERKFITRDYVETDGDDVQGYVTPDEVAEIIYRVSRGIKIGERPIW